MEARQFYNMRILVKLYYITVIESAQSCSFYFYSSYNYNFKFGITSITKCRVFYLNKHVYILGILRIINDY